VPRRPGDDLQRLLRRYSLPPKAGSALEALLQALARPEAPTSVHDRQHVLDVHIADSLTGLEIGELPAAATLADLGAGAGLPGLVLAAALPGTEVALVEATRRKCEFLRATVRAMGLENADVVCGRAEEWREGFERCDVVCARALAALPVLCEYAAPLLRENGLLVAWKGDVSESEAQDADAAASHLGLTAASVRRVFPFPGSRQLALHVFRKVAPTPAKYPRRAGIAAKRPLSVKHLLRERTNSED
jgi:16S rRNA (guanine527-N7)-methyltransferase